MSFLGGGSIGGAQIVLGAATSGLKREFKSAITEMKSGMNGLAADVQAAGNRTAAGINRVGVAADRNAAQVEAASTRTSAAMTRSGAAATRSATTTEAASARGSAAMKKGAAEAEAAGGRWGRVFGLIGNAAKLGFLGVAAFVGIGVKTAASFQKEWAGVVKTVGGTAPQMAKLREEVRGLAREMPVSVNDLAKVAETAGALGIPLKSIKEFVRVTAMIGSTTNVSVDQAATSLGVLGNVVGLRTTDYKKFASALVDLGNKGASTEKQILDITTRSAAAGKLLGLSTQGILAISSTAASMGVNPEAGGTALATVYGQLVKITAAEGKAGKGAKDLTKTREQLGVAEQRLAELRGKSHTKLSTLMAAENRVTDLQRTIASGGGGGGKAGTPAGAESFGKVAGVTAKAWKDLLKDHPEEAFQRLVAGLGKLTGPDQLAKLKEWGMSGLRVRNVMLLLAKNPGELARQLGISNEAWAKGTAAQEAYARKTANFLDRLKILGNVIKDALITLGDLALPVLTHIVDFLAKGIPGALAFLGTLWSGFFNTVKGPIGEVGKSVGGLLDAFSGDKAGKGIDWAKAMQTMIGGLANVVGTLATGLAKIIDIGAAFVRSPIGQFAVNALVPILALAAAVSGLMALAKRLTGAGAGLVRSMTGLIPGMPGFLRNRPQVDPVAAAMTEAADEHKVAAGSLKTSAAQLDAAAEAIVRAAYGEYGDPKSGLGVPYDPKGSYIRGIKPTEPNGLPEPTYNERGVLTSVPIDMKKDYLRNQKSYEAAAKNVVARGAASLADGIRAAAGGVKSVAAGAWGAVKGVGSLIGKAFFPLMIADLVTEFAKQPISDFVRQNTKFKNVADEMSKDFWGGARDLVIAAFNGTDAWVGHADELTIGNAKIKTIDVAKMGFTSAEIGTIEAPTLANGGFDNQKTAAEIRRQQYATMNPNDIIEEAKRSGIDTSGITPSIRKAASSQGRGVTAIYSQADVQPLVDKLIEAEVGGVQDTFKTAVQQALEKLGYGFATTDALPPDVLASLGHLIGANVNGKLDGLVAWAARDAMNNASPTTLLTAAQLRAGRTPAPFISPFYSPPGGFAGQSLTTAAHLKHQRVSPFYAPSGGFAGAAPVPIVDPFRPEMLSPFYAPVGGFAGPTPKIKRTNAMKSPFYAPSGGFAAADLEAASDAKNAFETNLSKVLQPMKETYKRWLKAVVSDPTGNRQAAAASGQSFLDAFGTTIGAAGAKGPTKTTSAILHMATQILGRDAVVKDKQGVKHLADGAWDAIWTVYQQALVASGESQRKALRTTMAAIIKQGAKDGASDASAEMTPLFFTENQKAIAAALKDPKGKQLTTLLASFNKANPTAQIGDVAGFKAAYDAWQKTGMLDPTKTGEASMKLSDVHSEMEDVATAATTLVGALGNLADTIDRLIGSGSPTPAGGGGGRAGAHPLAGGAVFDTRGRTNLTVGEAGGEHVAVLRNFRRVNLPDFFMPAGATPRVSGRAAQPGRTTQIYADKLQVLGPADEQSLLSRVAFLSNT